MYENLSLFNNKKYTVLNFGLLFIFINRFDTKSIDKIVHKNVSQG